MKQPHTSQLHAALVISKYSLLAMLKSPTSIVFSLLFPVIFITVFGAMIAEKTPEMTLALDARTDTASLVSHAIREIPSVKLQYGLTEQTASEALRKGTITGVLRITDSSAGPVPRYHIELRGTGASAGSLRLTETLLREAIGRMNQKIFPRNSSVASLSVIKEEGRVYRTIDFILPGQLGFSLLMAGVYGSSFLLFHLRQNLVLKRLRIAPVRRTSIIAGEMLSRLFFHIFSFIIMVGLGYFAFHFTLVNGAATFLEMLFFSLFGLIIFMGIGFMISGMVQNENSIAPIANTVVLPQILLCGLFFSIDRYPAWLRHICDILPLTFFVDGLRKIAFEGTHIWQMLPTIGALVIWILIIGPLAVKAFKWE